MAVSESPQKTSRRQRRPSSPTPDPCQEVLVALRRIIRATDLHSKRLAKESGLTIPQVVLLQSIRDMGEVTTKQLSGRVNLSQGTVTTILDRLEGRGLIERYRSVADRRIVHTRLTPQGRKALRKAPPLLHERFITAFSSLPLSEQGRLITALEQVAEMMGADALDVAPLLDVGSPVAPVSSGGQDA